MPIARSNTGRNHSRSPIPPSDRNHAHTRPFLPPSHYAAAAGISYTNSIQSSSRSEPSEFSEATPSIMSKDSSVDPQEYHSAFMPVSYPPESGATESDSSFEFRASSGSRYSASGGDKPSSSSKTPVRSKRQSHIAGLPQLETHLLPSLRDTIDRMTRTPSNAGSSSSASGSAHLEIPKPSEVVLSTSLSSPSSPQPSHPVHTDSFPTSSRLPEPSSSRAQSRSTTPMDPSTPRSKTPVKSALKSALRAPTPKLFSNPSSGAEAMGSSPSGGVSLKSVRSILSRKTSSASLSETPTPSGNSGRKSTTKKQTMVPSFQHLRGRSRTDPGITNSDFRSPSDKTVIPSETSHGVTMLNKTKQKPSTSGIPRLQSRLDTHYHTDDSDFEFQYETQERERRKLIVANAEVFASSSESEAEMKERYRAETAEAGYSKEGWRSDMNTHGTKNMVGLGLDLRSSTSRKRHSGGREPTNRRSGQTPSAENDTRLRDVNNWTPSARSQSSGRSTRKDYESSSDSYLATLDADHHRRRAALLGIVSSLDLQAPPVAAGESEESEYCGEDGFAISGSGELASQLTKTVIKTINSVNDDSGNYPEIRPRRTSHEDRRTSRPRSSSCMPTFVVSNDDEGNQIIHGSSSSHRPRSVHQISLPSPSAISNPRKGHKSPSRSPVVRQDDLASIPAALRRHSVYHRSPSPNAGVQSSNEKKLPKKFDYDRHDVDASDALMITERSYAAAARERRALGIPPSESVEVYQGVTHDGVQALTHAESDLSSVGSQYWNEGAEELSPGAETLFRKLSGGPTKEMERRRSYQQNADNSTRFSMISRRSSVSSVYEDQDSEDRWPDHGRDRTAVSHSEIVDPDKLLTNGHPEHDFGDVEMQRQDLIREICQTEKAFVNRLHTFVKLFVLPLRVQDSKTWILGVPSEVARLFDWLDDIMNLHNELLSSLQLIHTAQYPIVEHIAGSMRTFIPRLEVYQPYLVRLADVTSLIQQLVQDEKSDFGEFVDIQEGAAECEGWKFDRFLAEPVNRLAQYPDFFSRLVGLTPKTHPDYLSTFFLLHSTEMVIRVMTEVKVREDEYGLIKNFLSRIRGLPSEPQIATRERRLLFHGTLHLHTVDDEEVTILDNVLLPINTPQDYVPITQNGGANLPNRSSRLANAINKWDARRRRSESTSSSSTGTSFGTASSGASSDMPATPSSTFFSSFRIPVPDGRLNTARIPEQKRVLVSPSPNPRRPSVRGIPVQVFIFTDLVLLTTPNSSLTPENSSWTLLEDIGITRILAVSEYSEQDTSESDVFVVDTIPVDTSKFNQCMREEDGPVVTLRFLIPTPHTPMLSGKPLRPDEKTRNSWISAFQQCFRFTLRSASLPSRSKSFVYDLQSDYDHDTQQTVFSLLASGLPLPKSPSAQLVDLQHGQPGDIRRQEREERGWWSLRFQQIFRELQRQDMSVPV